MSRFHGIGLVGLLALYPSFATAQEAVPIALNSFSDVPDGINTALVVDRQGTTLGIVTEVETNTTGKPREVDVLMSGGRRISVRASSASYDFEAHRVIADTVAVQTAAEAAREPHG